VVLVLACGWGAPALAQVAGSVTVQNDYQFRGYALGVERPVAILNLNYDHPRGFYANGSIIGAYDDDEGPELLGLTANVGYARRLASGATLEAGFVATRYDDLYGVEESEAYAEVYVGALVRGVTARVYYSPDYFDTGGAVYGEVEAAVEPVPKLRLSAHLGALAFVGERPPDPRRTTQIDWSVAASRRFGAFDLHASVSGGGPDPEYYQGRPSDKAAVIAGVTWNF
jgi:uncharacterized protein (TIGR02001 family)